jgi:hypothetical protein
MSGLNSRLRKLRDEARTKNRFSIAAAASDLLEDTDDLDRRINLLGAMQSEGLLRNSLAPYWRELRDDETAWARACLARLVARDRDHDFWAVAALLGCRVDSVLEPVAAVGLRPWSLRWYTRFDAPTVHVASLSSAVAGAIRQPYVEIGWDATTHEIVDCARARAVHLEQSATVGDSIVGTGSIFYSMRARLPYGVWRIHEDRFELKAEHVLAYSASLLAGTV